MRDAPLPAGLAIDNPNLLRSTNIRGLDWLQSISARHTEFRSDRFLAAVDWRSDQGFDLAYIVRAVSPGEYHHPAALVQDMYRPEYRAITEPSRMTGLRYPAGTSTVRIGLHCLFVHRGRAPVGRVGRAGFADRYPDRFPWSHRPRR